MRLALAATRGRALFEDEACGSCHAIAATGAEGRFGPRLDAIDDDSDDIAEAIVEPREDSGRGRGGNSSRGGGGDDGED